ncbi:MAG: aminotransferase class III-fold pyridoxal phosphate-dependent enzyme [Gemmatimonadota bacterium]|nr:aminotransferase class III-fold pyridoxal phosphate-dependent enzyme [Gemmatimonadota bacterium]MDH5198113.1 aminotransferase class III-fold pyridoxal phosphate-dependent enzyme [Gemmatimonadota bacterium]
MTAGPPDPIPGQTSTGSKRAEALFGGLPGPRVMVRSEGCRVWDDTGRIYLDLGMALGAVALGYGHPAVVAAVEAAARDGGVSSLPPTQERALAERLVTWVPGAEAVRFLKTGAEAVAAAVRMARVVTGRDAVLTCGYHGWLDWCQARPGVPRADQLLHRALRFNDSGDLEAALAQHPAPAAIVIEPVVEDPPDAVWLAHVRRRATELGAALIFDEIKTGIRFGLGGAAERYGVVPDAVVLGKALGNGLPIAAVVGSRDLLDAATRTWISSTLATETLALAGALAVLDVCEGTDAIAHLQAAGARWLAGCHALAGEWPSVITEVRGVHEFSFLRFADAEVSAAVASAAARRGVLVRRGPYNFPSASHAEDDIQAALNRLADAVAEVAASC